MSNSAPRLSVVEKVGYSLGDIAANFVFQTMMFFQLSFYTDTFGLTAAAAGTMFLAVRFWDAFFDPLMGVVADRTRTRFGKFRPWILWTAVPFGVLALLAFTTPNLSYTGKLVYAYVTYTLLMMVYSANNLPYSALSGVMTGDVGERASVSSYRFVAAMIGAFSIQSLALPLVQFFGRGDRAHGYQYTMGLYAVLAAVFFLITFATTRERIVPPPEQKSSIRQDFADLVRNGPWIALFGVTIFVFVTLSMRGSTSVYFFKYYLEREDLLSWYNGLGLAANIVGILCSKALVLRFGSKATFLVGLAASTVLQAALYFIVPGAIVPAFVLYTLGCLAYGPTIPLLWMMMADVADYSEWKNHRRATGVIFSAIVFGLKAGLGLGGALAGWLLSGYGYLPNSVQSAATLQGIRLSYSLYAALPFAIALIGIAAYPIGRDFNLRMQAELADRRKRYSV
jgi:sugar (glycoside-pentoside-hexuronide) transporter